MNLTRKELKELTSADRQKYFCVWSDCEVRASKRRDIISIRFTGPLALVPSFKNQRICLPGRNFTDPIAAAHYKAMTTLYQRATRGEIPPLSGRLFCIVILADRPKTFDADNGFAGITDWLEPATKQKGGKRRDRGWGIGLVADDNQVDGFAIHSHYFYGYPVDYTEILITDWTTTVGPLREFYLGLAKPFFFSKGDREDASETTD